MWLVLCAANDLAALWAARELANVGLRPLEIVTAEALAYNRRFEHRLVAGQPTVNITLMDGRVIEGATVHGTLNRLQTIPFAHLQAANSTDRQYAEQEIFALYLSWLHGLPGVMLNRPTPQGLSGAWRHPSELHRLAALAGLSTARYEQGESLEAPVAYSLTPPTNCTIIVVQGRSCDQIIPPVIAAGCSRLAELTGTGMLGVDFHVTASGEWIFIRATPFPELRVGGRRLITTLAHVLNP